MIAGRLSASAASELLNRAIVRSKELTRAALEADRATKDRVFDTINRLRTLTTLGLASGLGSVVMLAFFAVGYVRMMQRERTYIARINRVLTESVQEREYFIKVASHELRNSAQAALALLDRDWTTDGRIRSGTMDAMIGFRENVDSLLDFARSISGRVDLSHSEIDVAQAVHAWVASASYGTGKRVVVDVDCLDHAISVQRTVLFRCFQNILTNALRHARSEVRVAVEILGDGCALKVRVQDDGPGIPKDVFASLRGRQAVHNESGGTLGMGLLIVKALIASVGGRLQFPDSKAGAVVEIEIPIRRTPSQTRDDRTGRFPQSRPASRPAPASNKLIEASVRILYCEDSLEIREAFYCLLKAKYQDVRPCGSVADFLRLSRDESYDVAVLDYDLGDGSAFDVVERLKQSGSCCKIIVLTGVELPEIRDSGFVDRVLTKPIQFQELVMAIDSVLYGGPRPARLSEVGLDQVSGSPFCRSGI